MSRTPKNLVVITSDEMRGDAPGFMGNPDCRTPNLDRLAASGVAFHNHFTVHGKSVPARVAMLTGRYSHTDGIRTVNETNLIQPGDPDLLSTLKARGYETAVFGHNHAWTDFWGDNTKGSGIVDYHSYTAEHFRPLLERKWPVPAPGPGAVRPLDLSRGGFHYGGRVEKPLDGFCDDNRIEQAVHYLTTVRDRSRPFYLHVNIGKPHPPYQIEEPYFSMYDRAAIRAWPHGLPEGAPLPLRRMRQLRTAEGASEAAFREIQAVYYGMVTKVDMLVGRLLEAVEAEGLFGDSVVMFAVDHGDFAGQYGLVEKWDTCMTDCILRVPQILRAPNLPAGVRVDGLTEHTDLAPTILELLDVPPAPRWGIHGESLLPVIRGERRKTAVFADGGHEEDMQRRFNFRHDGKGEARRLDGKQATYQATRETMARTKMIRTERWKMVIRLAGGNELYDLANDPWELNNRWGEPGLAPVIQDLQLQMIEWCLRTDTDRPHQERVGA